MSDHNQQWSHIPHQGGQPSANEPWAVSQPSAGDPYGASQQSANDPYAAVGQPSANDPHHGFNQTSANDPYATVATSRYGSQPGWEQNVSAVQSGHDPSASQQPSHWDANQQAQGWDSNQWGQSQQQAGWGQQAQSWDQAQGWADQAQQAQSWGDQAQQAQNWGDQAQQAQNWGDQAQQPGWEQSQQAGWENSQQLPSWENSQHAAPSDPNAQAAYQQLPYDPQSYGQPSQDPYPGQQAAFAPNTPGYVPPPGAAQPAPTQQGNFFGNLFNFSFKEPTTPKTAPTLFLLALVAGGMYILSSIITPLTPDSSLKVVMILLTVPVSVLVVVGLIRAALEAVIALTRSADSSRELKESAQEIWEKLLSNSAESDNS